MVPKDPVKNGMISLRELVKPFSGSYYFHADYLFRVKVNVTIGGNFYHNRFILANTGDDLGFVSLGEPDSPISVLETDLVLAYYGKGAKPDSYSVEYTLEIVHNHAILHTLPDSNKQFKALTGRISNPESRRATRTAWDIEGKVIRTFAQVNSIVEHLRRFAGPRYAGVSSPSSGLKNIRLSYTDGLPDTLYSTEPKFDTFISRSLISLSPNSVSAVIQ